MLPVHSSGLHTGVAGQGKHHWYPDKEFMRLYEGRALLWRDAPDQNRRNINIPDAILPARQEGPLPKDWSINIEHLVCLCWTQYNCRF